MGLDILSFKTKGLGLKLVIYVCMYVGTAMVKSEAEMAGKGRIFIEKARQVALSLTHNDLG